MVPLDALGGAYHRLASHRRVGRAVRAGARAVDVGAGELVRVLRLYPLGRLLVLAYLLGLHAMVYALLHRLQGRAFAGDLKGLDGRRALGLDG